VTLPTPPPIADAERIVCSYLRDVPEVSAIVSDRVYTAFPAQAGNDPLLLVQRIGGVPPFSVPLVLDEANLQIDAYGGPKRTAHDLISIVRASLVSLIGLVRPEGYLSSVSFGALRYVPDETFQPWRPRYIADVTVHVRTVVPSVELVELSLDGEEALVHA
jgi:hypothetical protein